MKQIIQSIGDGLPSDEEIQTALPFSKWVSEVLPDAQVTIWDAYHDETITQALIDWYGYQNNLEKFVKEEYKMLVVFTGHFQSHIFIEKQYHAILTEFIKDVSEGFTVESVFYNREEDMFEIIIDYGIENELPKKTVEVLGP